MDRRDAIAGLIGEHAPRLDVRLARLLAFLCLFDLPCHECGYSVEAIEQRLAGLAGASLREGANRRKLEVDNRGRAPHTRA